MTNHQAFDSIELKRFVAMFDVQFSRIDIYFEDQNLHKIQIHQQSHRNNQHSRGIPDNSQSLQTSSLLMAKVFVKIEFGIGDIELRFYWGRIVLSSPMLC